MPNARVSDTIREAFFGCSSSELPIASSAGVLPACDVRDYNPTFVTFAQKTPILPEQIATSARKIVNILKEKHIMKSIGFDDLIQELTPERVLTEREVSNCLEWLKDN
jgi:Protein of unknown function (DUF3684)